MTEIPYIAVGNNELGAAVGKSAKCPACKKKHKIEYGTDAKTGAVSNLLGFVSCGEHMYLVAVGGKEMPPPYKPTHE